MFSARERAQEMANGEIIVVPFHSFGHVFPATELARRLAHRDYRVTLLLPSAPSSSASLHPLIEVVAYSVPRPPPPPSSSSFSSTPPVGPPHTLDDLSPFRELLAERCKGQGRSLLPVCVIIDVMMSSLVDVCKEFEVPTVILFTSSACSTAMDHSVSKISVKDIGRDGVVMVPRLPEEMALTTMDLMHSCPPPPFGLRHPASEKVDGDQLLPPLMTPPSILDHHERPPPSAHAPLLPIEQRQIHRPPPPSEVGATAAPPQLPLLFLSEYGQAPLPSPQECQAVPSPFSRGHSFYPSLPRRSPFLPGCNPAKRPPPFDHQSHGGSPPPPLTPRPSDVPSLPPLQLGEGRGRPATPGPPHGLVETDGAIALLFNTCEDLEQQFLEYIADEAKKPVWGIGPLLPSEFWSAASSVLHDNSIRPRSDEGIDNTTTINQADVLRFLDSKPRGSVIYVSFGSLVVPSDVELAELASALEESNRSFIWAIQPQAMRHDVVGRPMEGGEGQGYFPKGLAEKVAGRGLVIHGWAPQLLILSHPATGGFLTHCGWNSIVEAIGLGVPVLSWPVHGDQIWNAKFVVKRLKTGLAIKDSVGPEGLVTRGKVADGIKRLMTDVGTREQAAKLAREMFAGDGFPASSEAALDSLLEFVAKHDRNRG
ncbi:hypothetical protein Cni_G14218 [Canna indica]|uniref:Glycosyltransferase n=1 Tax=Canna indica TaxID=4628 RepID=A0AAQ3QC64_9LILI|nr:hypothetical protein Cni_G14218 [Canna indica]